jgi:hypothetical protein
MKLENFLWLTAIIFIVFLWVYLSRSNCNVIDDSKEICVDDYINAKCKNLENKMWEMYCDWYKIKIFNCSAREWTFWHPISF